MDASVTKAGPATSLVSGSSPRLRLARTLTALIIVLAATAAAGGLFHRGLYREPADFVPVLRDQDLVTLVAMPVMVVTLLTVTRGSARTTITIR